MAKISFDEKSMLEWYENLEGKEKAFIKRVTLNRLRRDETKSLLEALIDARMAFILGKAICTMGYIEMKPPQQIWKELYAEP